MASSEDIKSFPQKDSRRFLHAVYRVMYPDLKAHSCSAATCNLHMHCLPPNCTCSTTLLMVQVGKLDETIKYYKENFGMEQLRYRDVPDVRRCHFGWQGSLQPDV